MSLYTAIIKGRQPPAHNPYINLVRMEAGYGHYRVIALSTCAQRDNATTR